MNNFFRAIIAAWGAKKLGGGCLSTIVIFIVIYSLLGKCNNAPRSSTHNMPHEKGQTTRYAKNVNLPPGKEVFLTKRCADM